MKAIVISQHGDTSALVMQDLPKPEPRYGEVLVSLKAAGLNFIDIYMRRGELRIPVTLPFIPGREGAGIVEKVGDGVEGVKVGDRVAFVSSVGTYAEYCCIDANLLIPLPDNIDYIHAAAFPLQGMTAHYLVNDFYPVTNSSSVLVHAAAGGVGLLLVQWLHHLGARVIGTVSTPEKARIAKHAGASDVILYSSQDFVLEIKKLTNDIGVDYVIDGVGKTTFTKSLEAVRVCGWVCVYGSASGAAEPLLPNSLQAKSIVLAGGSLFPRIQDRDKLLMRANAVLKGISDGWLTLNIDNVMDLNDVAHAHQLLESRKTSGKIVLKINE